MGRARVLHQGLQPTDHTVQALYAEPFASGEGVLHELVELVVLQETVESLSLLLHTGLLSPVHFYLFPEPLLRGDLVDVVELVACLATVDLRHPVYDLSYGPAGPLLEEVAQTLFLLPREDYGVHVGLGDAEVLDVHVVVGLLVAGLFLGGGVQLEGVDVGLLVAPVAEGPDEVVETGDHMGHFGLIHLAALGSRAVVLSLWCLGLPETTLMGGEVGLPLPRHRLFVLFPPLE